VTTTRAAFTAATCATRIGALVIPMVTQKGAELRLRHHNHPQPRTNMIELTGDRRTNRQSGCPLISTISTVSLCAIRLVRK